MMRRLSTTAAVLIAALAATVDGQRAGEVMQVTVVEVPVTVVDRDGNAVRGLTAANFEVSDDGKRVPVEYFEVLDMTTVTAEKREGAVTPPAATRHFLLMFDLANSSPGTIVRAGDAAKGFVAEQLGERDVAAVATFTAESGARMITNFTRNRALLVNAIETLGHPKYFKVADPLMISAQVPSDRGPAGNGPGRTDIEAAYSELTRESQANQQMARDTELRDRLKIQLTNMGNVARALDRLSGQKQIILLSEGFDAGLVQGRENLGSSEAQAETADVLAGEVWKVDSDKRFGNTSSSRDVSEMVQIFRRSDVVLHAIDIKGLRGAAADASTGGPATRKTAEALHLITAPTGGTVFKNANDMTENFAKLLRQQEVIYILGFKAKGTGKPGKFHTLKVKPVNARSARVSHRSGYYEPSELTPLQRSLTMADILMTDAPIKDVAVATTATPLPGPSGRARVPVLVEIPGSRLLQSVEGTAAHVELLLYAFDKNSQVIDYLQERISLDLAKAGDTIRAGGVRYYGTLRLPPGGQYAVKTVVRVEESGLIGYHRNDVTVPSFEQPSVMPPMLFADPGNWAMVFGPPRGDDYPYPFAAGQTKYVPNGNPSIAGAGDYKVALFLFRVPVENLSVTPTLVTADGTSRPAEVNLLGRTSPDPQGIVKLLFNFKAQSMAAGNHELRFDVKSTDGKQSVVVLPFTVQ